MAKVKDVLGQRPSFPISELDGSRIDPSKIWVRYDAESDSVVIYLTGSPQPSVSVYTADNLYVMVDPKSHNVVGLHVENWESSFVPAHTDVQSVWVQIKQQFRAAQPWNEVLRMLALWTIFVLKAENKALPALQPA